MSKLSPQPLPDTTKGSDRIVSRLATFSINFVKANQEAIQIWVSWRIVFIILPIFAAAFIPRPPAYINIKFNNPIEPWIEALVTGWSQWDSNWYILIAGQSYINDQTVAFYPLFPFLLRGVGFLISLGQATPATYQLGGVIISSISALALCILFIRLLLLDYSREVTRCSLIYLIAFPTAFFLFAVYTESLFMALSIGAFYAARRERWLIAMVLVALSILTRQQGILVGFALLFEYGQQAHWNWRKINYQVIFFGLPVLSLGGWLFWNWVAFGNPLASVLATQKYWGRHLTWPWQSFLSEIGGFMYREPGATTWQPITEYWDAMPVLNIALTSVFIIVAIYSFKFFQKGQLRLAYLVFLWGCLLLPLSSPVSDDPLHSMPRYLLISFPTFIILAILGMRWRLFNQTWLTISVGMSGMLVARFTLGYWVA